MTVLNAFRDFADGLSRGFSLYFTQRNDFIERTVNLDTRSGSFKRR